MGAPSFFDFQTFRNTPVALPESIRSQQSLPTQQVIQQPTHAPQRAPQFRVQQQQPKQQPRQQPRQQQQFRQQPQARVQQQMRVQPRPQSQQGDTGFQVQSSVVTEFLPANSQEAQQIRQQIVNGNFDFQRKPVQPPVQQQVQQQPISRPAPRPAPRRLAPRPAPRPAPKQASTRFNSFPQQERQQPQTLKQQLRVFAPEAIKAQPQPPPQAQPQQTQQSRFSNFRANPLRSKSRGAVPVTDAPVQSAALTPSPQQFDVATLRPTPAQDEVFNDYDSGDHRLSRFQLFQLRKEEEKLAASVVAQTVEINQVQPDEEAASKQKVVAVRRKKVRG